MVSKYCTILTLTEMLGDGLSILSLTSSLKAAKDEEPLGHTSVENMNTDSVLVSMRLTVGTVWLI